MTSPLTTTPKTRPAFLVTLGLAAGPVVALGFTRWENVAVAGGDLAETVNRLKAQPGGDMIVYGGGTLVSSLIAEGLVDELHLFVNPTAIGAGMPVFADLGAHQRLRLVAAHPFDCGITALHFEPKRG
jgi:dihydrofolate reductase